MIVEWIDSICSGKDSCFVFIEICSLEFSFVFGLFNIFFYCFALFGCCNFGQQSMFRCKSDVRHPINGINTSSIDADRVVVSLYLHGKFCSFCFTDPMTLHLLDAIWSFDEFIESLQESICIVGDSDDSLSHGSSFYGSARSFTVSILIQIFLCNGCLEIYGSENWFIVNVCESMVVDILFFSFVRQSFWYWKFTDWFCFFGRTIIVMLVEFDKCPLCPFVKLWVSGIYFSIPVISKSNIL